MAGSILLAAVIAAGVVLLTGPFFIPKLHKLKFGQSIREEGPKSHQIKSGTPTMGGIMLVAGILAASLIIGQYSTELFLALFIMLGHFVIGFIDDYIKVVLKRNLGLKAREKLLAQVMMAVVVIYIGVGRLGMSTSLWIPFWGVNIDLGWLYYALVLFVLAGTTNAVNLTDGLDGLAAGTMAAASATYVCICLYFAKLDMAVFCASVFGACLGFLRFNAHPAKIFMGDTGSLALGGALAAAAILTRTELLLIVTGGVFVMETLSVIIQVTSFKIRGKRVFLMSPIHHHFELKGWPETKVVTIFCAAGILLGALSLCILDIS